MVHGCGWPYSSLTLNVRVLAPDASTVVWFGTVPSATGKVDPSPTWPIPCSATAGVYYIQVEDPFNPGIYYTYDRFTIVAPEVGITKSASPDTADSGGEITYSIEVVNTGNATAEVTQLVDVLPGPFSYVSGSTVINGASAPNPSVNGDILTWPGSWVIAPGSSFTVSFKVKAGTQQGIFSNNVTVYGTNFCPSSTGNVAPVTVTAPQLSLTKKVDKDTAGPGEVLTYNLIYENTGHGEAQWLVILETMPMYTNYLVGSATSSPPLLVEYSYDGGLNWSSSDTAGILTTIRWQRTSLAGGSSGTATFEVVVE